MSTSTSEQKPPEQNGLRRFRITRRGWLYLLLTLIIGVNAVLSNNNPLFMMAVLLAGGFGTVIFIARTMLRGIISQRWLPPALHACEEGDYRIQVRCNHGRLDHCFLELYDQTTPNQTARKRGQHTGPCPTTVLRVFARIRSLLPGKAQTTRLESSRRQRTPFTPLPPLRQGEQVELDRFFRPDRRGWNRFAPLQLRCRLPFGLLEMTRSLGSHDQVLVFPQRRRLTRQFFDSAVARETGLQAHALTAGPECEDFAGLREFRDGDNPRLIHWKSSSRLPDQLLLKQYERGHERRTVVLLDTCAAVPLSEALSEMLEDNICFALALIEALITQGQAVTFGAFTPQMTRLDVRGGSPQSFNELKRTLALLAPSPEHSVRELVSLISATPQTTCLTLLLSPQNTAIPAPSIHHLFLTANEVKSFLSPVSNADSPPSYA
ncbi:MAG TPA: DUF58 domain-containing protein [Candidatus Paceibacterota bacterium]|nr:DUF58 domain-containing protein [Candidatus Paceibacterota bacterium]